MAEPARQLPPEFEQRKWAPGQSGNPNGRPKGLARVAREAVGGDGKPLVEFWLSIVNDPDAKLADRLEASRLLADRGFGKAASLEPVREDDPLGLNGTRDALVGRLQAVPRGDDERREAPGAEGGRKAG